MELTRWILVAGGLAIVVLAIDVFLMAFLGIILGIALFRVAGFLPLPRRAAVGLVLALLLVVVGLVGWWTAPRLVGEVRELAQQAPETWQELIRAVPGGPWVQGLLPSAQEARGLLERAPGALSRGLGALATLGLSLVLGILLALDPETYRRGLLQVFPSSRRLVVGGLLAEMGEALWRWVVGRAVAMSIVAALTAIGLWALGIPLVMLLSLLAGALNVIPNIGPLLAMAPAVLLAFSQGASTALWVALLYGLIQLVESYLLAPNIDRQSVQIPPALLILVQVLAGALLGWMGLLLATPLTAVAFVLIGFAIRRREAQSPRLEAA